jgi:hypothetical protein
MAPRLELHDVLKDILGTDQVYFQPPPNVEMQYPCIVYHRTYIQTNHADDIPYRNTIRYQVTVIDRDPDSAIPMLIMGLPLCTYDRFYTADKLNHDVFKLFF